jgi:hypothetical protein
VLIGADVHAPARAENEAPETAAAAAIPSIANLYINVVSPPFCVTVAVPTRFQIE